MTEQEPEQPIEETTPPAQRVIDAARDLVAARLEETEADEKLSRLADAIDELDGTTAA